MVFNLISIISKDIALKRNLSIAFHLKELFYESPKFDVNFNTIFNPTKLVIEEITPLYKVSISYFKRKNISYKIIFIFIWHLKVMLKYLSVLWKTKTVLVCWQTILTITNAKYKNEKRKKKTVGHCMPILTHSLYRSRSRSRPFSYPLHFGWNINNLHLSLYLFLTSHIFLLHLSYIQLHSFLHLSASGLSLCSLFM